MARIFSFECCTCGESFNVYSENLVQKDCLVCPNCSNRLSDEVFQKLKASAQLLIEVDKNSKVRNASHLTNRNPNHFDYKIQ